MMSEMSCTCILESRGYFQCIVTKTSKFFFCCCCNQLVCVDKILVGLSAALFIPRLPKFNSSVSQLCLILSVEAVCPPCFCMPNFSLVQLDMELQSYKLLLFMTVFNFNFNSYIHYSICFLCSHPVKLSFNCQSFFISVVLLHPGPSCHLHRDQNNAFSMIHFPCTLYLFLNVALFTSCRFSTEYFNFSTCLLGWVWCQKGVSVCR